MSEKRKVQIKCNEANTLASISTAVLWLGIITYIVMFLSSCFVDSGKYSYSTDYAFQFNFIALISYLPILLGAIFANAIGQCVARITLSSSIQQAYLEDKENIEFSTEEKDI